MKTDLGMQAFLWLGLASLMGFAQAKTLEPTYGAWSQILQRYVCSEGVRYAALKASGELARVDADFQLDRKQFSGLDTAAQMAYLINLYNARTLALVVEHYPVKSIREVKEPWKRKIVPLFGDTVSLDEVEHHWLRGPYREPRVHVALNCASISCPPLQNQPYRGALLEKQLQSAWTAFLTDGKRNRRQQGVIQASRLFEWYGDDFRGKYGDWKSLLTETLGGKGPRESQTPFRFEFLDYDWNLNEVPKCQAK
jgi:Protein of unknown function, DUF547